MYTQTKAGIGLCLVLMGCGGMPDMGVHQDSRALEYVASWELMEGRLAGHVPIYFVPEWDKGTAGQCAIRGRDRMITVNLSAWNRYTHEQRASLIWHELGHCVSGLGHDDRKDEAGCPVSYMFFQVVNSMCMTKTYKEYL